jgi:hypothetical protein
VTLRLGFRRGALLVLVVGIVIAAWAVTKLVGPVSPPLPKESRTSGNHAIVKWAGRDAVMSFVPAYSPNREVSLASAIVKVMNHWRADGHLIEPAAYDVAKWSVECARKNTAPPCRVTMKFRMDGRERTAEWEADPPIVTPLNQSAREFQDALGLMVRSPGIAPSHNSGSQVRGNSSSVPVGLEIKKK